MKYISSVRNRYLTRYTLLKKMQPHAMSSTSRFKKRERTQNWSFEEKKYLLELCKRDMNIIENKRLDADLTALKNRAWKYVHQEFSKTFGSERNCNRLKEQWRRMKACTRSEILDYTHRIAKFGQEVADKKRPHPFTFEIWEFMQNAKKACKNDTPPDVDYSTFPILLNDEKTTAETETNQNIEEPTILSDDDDNDLFNWQKANQSICEVEIKEGNSSNDDLSNSNHQISIGEGNKKSMTRKRKRSLSQSNEISFKKFPSNQSITDAITPMSMSNMSATLDFLSTLKSRSNHGAYGKSNGEVLNDSNNNNKEIQLMVEMQAREHSLRMDILRTQLEASKLNRDIAEIHKLILLKELQQNTELNLG